MTSRDGDDMNDANTPPDSIRQSDRRDRYTVYARTLRAAALAAAERDLSLRSWSWVCDKNAPEEPIITDLGQPEPPAPTTALETDPATEDPVGLTAIPPTAAGDRAAIAAFVEMTHRWGLSAAQSRGLIGGMRAGSWIDWTTAGTVRPTTDQLTRIGHLLGIYADLHAIHDQELADAWVTLPNTNPIFAGRTPCSAMTAGGIPAMAEVRDLLDARRHQQ